MTADLATLRRALELLKRYRTITEVFAGETLDQDLRSWEVIESLLLEAIDGEQENVADKARPF